MVQELPFPSLTERQYIFTTRTAHDGNGNVVMYCTHAPIEIHHTSIEGIIPMFYYEAQQYVLKLRERGEEARAILDETLIEFPPDYNMIKVSI